MSEVIPYVATFPSGQQVLVQRHFSDDGYEHMTVALRGSSDRVWGPPETLELGPSSRGQEIMIGPPEGRPVCPGCGAEGQRTEEGGWITAHDLDCSWLNDPDSEPYS